MIHHYFCVDCNIEFTAVIHYGITPVVRCPYCHATKNLPKRKRIYYLNSPQGFKLFDGKDEFTDYKRSLVVRKQFDRRKKLRS